MKGGEDSHQLRWGDISLQVDELGREYLEFDTNCIKRRFGSKNSTSKLKQYAHPGLSTCPVQAYKLFTAHRPANMCQPDSPFYLSINTARLPGSHYWYKAVAMGEKTLQKILKNMAAKAGLSRKVTNQSAKQPTCTHSHHAEVTVTPKAILVPVPQLPAMRDLQLSVSNTLSPLSTPGAVRFQLPTSSTSGIITPQQIIKPAVTTGHILMKFTPSTAVLCVGVFMNLPNHNH